MKQNNHTVKEQWCYEHQDVRGLNALMFFTWDLSKTIEMAFSEVSDAREMESYVDRVQASIDVLLQRYVDIKASPDIFEGEFIRVHYDTLDENGHALFTLETSPQLEKRISDLQQRVKAGNS